MLETDRLPFLALRDYNKDFFGEGFSSSHGVTVVGQPITNHTYEKKRARKKKAGVFFFGMSPSPHTEWAGRVLGRQRDYSKKYISATTK